MSYFNRLRKLADMADIKTMTEKELVMHMVMLSLPTNVVKQVTNITINPKLDDVLATLEVVEQHMRLLNNTNFLLPPDRSAKKKKSLSANVTEEKDRGQERGGGGGCGGRGRGRGAGGNARGGGQTGSYTLSCFRCGEDHYKDQCTKMPSECKCSHCHQTGHVEKVCLTKRRASANMSEEAKTEEKGEKENGEKEKRSQTPPNGVRDFSRGCQANLVTVKYLDEEDVHHTSALLSYQLCNAAYSVRGKLRRLSCKIERKERGGAAVQIVAVCDPGATASLLSLSKANNLDCQQREARGIVISTANGASLDVRSQCEIWMNTNNQKRRLVHVYVVADLSQDMLISADDCEALGLLLRNWPNHGPGDATYSKLYQANSVETAQKQENEGRVYLTELQERLWLDTGDITCIPNMQNIPENLQKMIQEFWDVFSDSIGDRPMDVPPVKLTVDESVPKPAKTMTCRAIPLHWQDSGECILTDLLQAGIVKSCRTM